MNKITGVVIGGLVVIAGGALIWGSSLLGKVSDAKLDASTYKSQIESMIAKQSADNATIESLNAQLVDLQNAPKAMYFTNRTAITAWLSSVPKLGVSTDAVEWYQYGLYYQQQALKAGYIISVAYTVVDESVLVWCEVVDANGKTYYFDPDDCVLKDSNLRVDVSEVRDYSITPMGYTY